MNTKTFSVEELAVIERQAMGRLFGCGIEEARNTAGLSIDEAAAGAGMAASEWVAIESGQVPDDWEPLGSMAAAMKIRPDKIALYALLCHRAWQQ